MAHSLTRGDPEVLKELVKLEPIGRSDGSASRRRLLPRCFGCAAPARATSLVTRFWLTADIRCNERPLRALAQKSAKPEYAMNAKPLLFGPLMLAAFAVGQARAEERQAGYV